MAAGISDTVLGITTLVGRSTNVQVDSATTTVHWPAGSTSPNIVRDASGHIYVQDVDGSGRPTFQEVGYLPRTDTVTGLSDVGLYPSGPLVFDALAAVAPRGFGTPNLLDDTNTPISGGSLVQADDGRYFILKAGNYYAAAIRFGQSGALSATATDMTAPLTAADFATLPATLTQTPAVDPATDSVAFEDSSGTTISASAARLLQRSDGTYTIEVDAGGGNLRYYDANVAMEADGTTRTMTARAMSTAYQVFTDLPSLGGTSYITLNPANVTVNYTDGNGFTRTDVMTLGDDGSGVGGTPAWAANFLRLR